jgi:hypothetical protein
MLEEALKSQSQANGAAGVIPRDGGWRRCSSHQRSRSVDKRADIDGGDDYADETYGNCDGTADRTSPAALGISRTFGVPRTRSDNVVPTFINFPRSLMSPFN